VLSRGAEPLPPDTERRLAEFSRHAAMAVANANSRAEVQRSRARIVRAGDEARRRLERDLHDGAQQRLVSLSMELSAAESRLPDLPETHEVLAEARGVLRDVLEDLRELSRGLHPTALSEGGLAAALRSLSRRSAIPVDLELDADVESLPETVEVAAYYTVSEALTNTAKHAGATRVHVRVARREDGLQLTIADDGKGGADPANGSGLTGLADRVEAIGGTLRIDSPDGQGTTLSVRLPTAAIG
jgi:signal transduction histidine kinase